MALLQWILQTPLPWVIWGTIGCFGGGGILPLVAAITRPRQPGNQDEVRKLGAITSISLILALVGSAFAFCYAIATLIMGGSTDATLLVTQPSLYHLPDLALTAHIDRLAAFFWLLISGLSFGIAIYSFEFLRKESDRLQIAGSYNLFVLFGLLFVVASNVFFFILLLELVSLAFGALVLHEHSKDLLDEHSKDDPTYREHQQAIKIYLIANHIGGIFVAAAILLLAQKYGSFSMKTFASHSSGAVNTGSDLDNLIFLLALIGFGIKAGIVPFHVWVAVSHPSSPTNTHAMSLGIMIKIGLYGMIRVFFQYLHPKTPPLWWGLTVLLIAGLTALFGVRNALYGRTLKDSLADHSVENIGIILSGIGLALTFASGDLPPVFKDLAGLALVAGLYHLLNHTVFKGLLYLCTGAIYRLTNGEVRLNELGGLVNRFRWTSACFLVGSVAIAGVPPFNGFISEWLILQTLFASMNLLATSTPHGTLTFIVLFTALLLSALSLATAFALTAFAFVKIAGEALLGRPHNEVLAKTFARQDVAWKMRGVMLALAVLCLVLGVFPGLVLQLLGPVAGDLKTGGMSLNPTATGSIITGVAIKVGGYSASLQASFLFILGGLVILAAILALRSTRAEGEVWAGGALSDPSTMQYTSGAFVYPIWAFVEGTARSTLRALIIPRKEELESSTPSRSHQEHSSAMAKEDNKRATELSLPSLEVSKERRAGEPFRWVYSKVVDLLRRLAQWSGSFFQKGDLHRYLGYIFLFFILVILIFILLTGGPNI